MDVDPLKGAILVELEQGGTHEFMQDELQPLEELEALKKKTGEPCENCPEDNTTGRKTVRAQEGEKETAWPTQIKPQMPGNLPKRFWWYLAHPDDPEFFCGATTARWVKAGHTVSYCVVTCGDKGPRI